MAGLSGIALSALGTSGLKETGGFIHEEFLHTLRFTNGQKIFREMANNNAIVGASLLLIDLITRKVDWRVETPKGMEEDPIAQREREFIEGAVDDMSHTFQDFISETLSMLVQGWSYHEIIYKIRRGDSRDPKRRSKFDDGRWGWRKIEARGQETLNRWDFDPEDHGLNGMVQLDTFRANNGPVLIPIEKSLLFRTKSFKGNPEGTSWLRPVVDAWFRLKKLERTEIIGFERNLAGMPIFQVPQEMLLEDAATEEKEIVSALERIVQQLGVHERFGGVIPSKVNKDGTPSGFEFGLLSPDSKKVMPTDTVIKRLERTIGMAFLDNFMFLGMDNVGAQSAEESKQELFKGSIETILSNLIAPVFNRFAVGRLESLNKVPQQFWPLLVPGKITSPDLGKIGVFIRELATAGVLSPNPKLENTLLDMANLPTPPEEELEIFQDGTQPTPREASDQAIGVLSQSQIDALMSINRAIKKRELSRDVAKELAAQALGMDPSEVDKFLIEEPPPVVMPPIPPAPGPIGVPPNPAGSLVDDDDDDDDGDDDDDDDDDGDDTPR